MADPLFTVLAGGSLLPNGTSRGPWSPDALHGGPVAAAAVRAAEAVLRSTGSEAVEPVRLTLDIERPVPLAPLRFEAEIVRPGKKVQVAGITVTDETATTLVTGRVLAIRRADLGLPEHFPAPADPPPPPPTDAVDAPMWNPQPGLDAFHKDGVVHRYVAGSFMTPGPATDWIRLEVPVVQGEEPSPFQRAVAAADFVNGISGVLPFDRWTFINPDLTVTVHRTPVGEWICLDAVTRVHASGIATAEADLFDEEGRFGRCVQTLIVQPAPGTKRRD